MPVVDANLMAVAVMYIAYLLVTGGVKKHVRRLRLRQDGELEAYDERELWGPMGIFSMIQSLFRRTGAEKGPK